MSSSTFTINRAPRVTPSFIAWCAQTLVCNTPCEYSDNFSAKTLQRATSSVLVGRSMYVSREEMKCKSPCSDCSAHCNGQREREANALCSVYLLSNTATAASGTRPPLSHKIAHQTLCHLPFFRTLEAPHLHRRCVCVAGSDGHEINGKSVLSRVESRPTFSLGLLMSFGRPIWVPPTCMHSALVQT